MERALEGHHTTLAARARLEIDVERSRIKCTLPIYLALKVCSLVHDVRVATPVHSTAATGSFGMIPFNNRLHYAQQVLGCAGSEREACLMVRRRALKAHTVSDHNSALLLWGLNITVRD
jgi:hypothetical protein